MNLFLAGLPGGSGRTHRRRLDSRRSTTSPTGGPPPPLAPDVLLQTPGGRVLRSVHTPHVPHGWQPADATFEEDDRGRCSAAICSRMWATALVVTADDVVEPAMVAEAMFGATCPTPATAADDPHARRSLQPRTVSRSCTARRTRATPARHCSCSWTSTTADSTSACIATGSRHPGPRS